MSLFIKATALNSPREVLLRIKACGVTMIGEDSSGRIRTDGVTTAFFSVFESNKEWWIQPLHHPIPERISLHYRFHWANMLFTFWSTSSAAEAVGSCSTPLNAFYPSEKLRIKLRFGPSERNFLAPNDSSISVGKSEENQIQLPWILDEQPEIVSLPKMTSDEKESVIWITPHSIPITITPPPQTDNSIHSTVVFK